MHGIGDHLRRQHVSFELILHRPAATASQRAESLHVPGRQVAKGVLVYASGRPVLLVMPATHRIEIDRLMEHFGSTDVVLAKEDDLVRVFFDCERGAVPALGSLYGIETIVDTSLGGSSEIVFDGNSRHESVRIRYRDFEAVEKPRKARFASWAQPRRSRSRRAG
jgi:Ala-tRNA(Pro) deacylase